MGEGESINSTSSPRKTQEFAYKATCRPAGPADLLDGNRRQSSRTERVVVEQREVVDVAQVNADILCGGRARRVHLPRNAIAEIGEHAAERSCISIVALAFDASLQRLVGDEQRLRR